MNGSRNSWLGLLIIPCLSTIGCSDGRSARVPVSGQVLIDGVPLQYGYVRFVPKGSRASGGKIDKNGRYTLTCFEPGDGAVVGKHLVEVSACEPLSPTKAKWHAPKKYSDYRTADLTFDVTGPTDNAIIKLSGEDGKPFVPIIEVQQTTGR